MKTTEKKLYKGKIQAVIFDWAGTTVDYGCFAPLIAVKEIFNKYGIEPTMKQIRKPMGLAKIDHITKMLKMKDIKKQWKEKYGKKPKKDDILKLYSEFEKALFSILPDYAKPIDKVVKTVNELKKQGIKIGSTTGYTSEMIDIILPLAREMGYNPDSIVASSDVPKGRPSPLMCYQNMINLNIHHPEAVIKVGDTLADIKEGINSGMWSVGVIYGSSVLGLSEREVEEMPEKKLKKKAKKVKKKYKKKGAHYIIKTMDELLDIIPEIEKKLEEGIKPVKIK